MVDKNTRMQAVLALMDKGRNTQSPQPVLEAAVQLSEEFIRSGDPQTALGLLERVRDAHDAIPDDTQLRLYIARATALAVAGLCAEALDASRQAACSFQAVLARSPESAARLRVLQGSCLWMLNQPGDSVDLLTELRGRLLSRPDSSALASCTVQLSAAHSVLGHREMAASLALDALVSARRSVCKYAEGQALTQCCRLERESCRWAGATQAGEEALRIFETLGAHHQANHVLRGLVLIAWKRGQLKRALEMSDQLVRQASELHNTVLLSLGLLSKSLVLTHLGDFGQATSLLSQTPGWDVPQGRSRAAILSIEYLGDIFIEAHDVERAKACYDDAMTRARAVAPQSDIVADLHRRVAECHYVTGRYDTAYTDARTGLASCRALGDRYEEAATYRVLALSAGAMGKPDEARKWFDEGFAHYEDIGTPYEWGRLWLAYGDWLQGAHAGPYADCRGALEAYCAACDHFERIGAGAQLLDASARVERLRRSEGRGLQGRSSNEGTDVLRATPRRPRRSTQFERQSSWAFETFGLVTRNKALLTLLDDVRKLAASQTPMLILGESGTGKELIARGIHALSLRKGTFMAVNASSLPKEIIESELFGHVAGAFTGATKEKAGMFEVCSKGTVFLDEIAEMSVELQSRLLRFLETGESRRVGANCNVSLDTRVVAATNRDRTALERGEGFRLDLYYRLAHAVVQLPPLRHRGDDVELLAMHFLEEACASAHKHVRLSSAAVRRLNAYSWPGNVRQLRAVIKRVVLLGTEVHEVTPEELHLETAEVPRTLTQELEQAERRRVGEALATSRGSRTEAARMLGMPRTTLINKMKRYGLT